MTGPTGMKVHVGFGVQTRRVKVMWDGEYTSEEPGEGSGRLSVSFEV